MSNEHLAETAKALGTPTRVAMVRKLAPRPFCVEALARQLGITPSAVSQHLRRLAAVGLVRGRRLGQHVHYELRTEGLVALRDELTALLTAHATDGGDGGRAGRPIREEPESD